MARRDRGDGHGCSETKAGVRVETGRHMISNVHHESWISHLSHVYLHGCFGDKLEAPKTWECVSVSHIADRMSVDDVELVLAFTLV